MKGIDGGYKLSELLSGTGHTQLLCSLFHSKEKNLNSLVDDCIGATSSGDRSGLGPRY